MKKVFIVSYSAGSYDDFYTKTIFVTDKKSKATKYVTKFNKLVKKWEQYYEQFEVKIGSFKWLDEKYVKQHFSRWHSLKEINNCYWEQIEIR